MTKDTLEFLLLITKTAYVDYVSDLAIDNRDWVLTEDKKYPLMLQYEKAIAELKKALDIDK